MITDVLLFYVQPQNAAILVRKRSTGAIFECFEVLPKTEAVLSAKDSLLRQFPARAVFLPQSALADESFTQELGNAIHKLSVEHLKLAMETTKKMDNTIAEERQSAHPRAVSEWLFGLLGSRGKATSSPVIYKRTHDDVCWMNTQLPWRRSGVWLSVRVALQLALQNADLVSDGHSHYKNFMLFLLSQLAAKISAVETSSDTLHILRVKLARRNAKLGSSTFGFVQEKVTQTLAVINESMQIRWKQVMESNKIIVQPIPVTQVTNHLSMKKSDRVTRKIWERSQQGFSYSCKTYAPPSCSRISLPKQSLPTPDIFRKSGDLLFGLVDFELWIENNLQDWLKYKKRDPAACRDLSRLMEKYFAVAKVKYDGHVERISIMFLVLGEMWVALDEIATETHLLLLDYPPEIPETIFAPLLLNTQAELERLSRIELHIASRRVRCKPSRPSLFSNPSEECFAVRFYDQSPALQDLRRTIEAEAHTARNTKSQEWASKKKEFDSKMKEVESMECGIFIPRGIDKYGKPYVGSPRHDRYCRKCAIEKAAKNIEINKHEWPLPADDMMCKAVVFELGVPEEIAYWRDTTFFIIQDVGRTETSGRPCKQVLPCYAPLENHAQRKDLRITLGSAVKPILKSHYIKGLLSLDEVFVSNGLLPKMKDTTTPLLWTAEQVAKPSLQRYCISKLSSSLHDQLGRQVNFTTHSQNSVIAKHVRSPPEMGPHEYIVFGSLRSGERLQWLNLLGALMSTEIDLNNPATATLFQHAVSQVGSAGPKLLGYLRESQDVLRNEAFCSSLLNALEESFTKIEANWKEAPGASVLLGICLKVLSLSSYAESHMKIVERCKKLISRIRKSGLTWMRQLARLHTDQKSCQVSGVALKDLSRQILSAALLTRHTYALSKEGQEHLFSDYETVADYVEASIYLHSHRDSCSDSADSKMETDLLNDAYLARRREGLFQEALEQDGAAITAGILRFWPTAVFTSRWKVVHEDDSSWLENQTSSKIAHYNLVTGSLLVSGRPLSRLPADYCQTDIYRAVFGDLELDVFAADLDDMEYVSKDSFCGHRVYFGRRDGELLIRSQANGGTFEAVLPDVFLGDLPHSVVKNSVPWLSFDDGSVVFRPREHPWTWTDRDWTLFLNVKGRKTVYMQAEQKYLIDSESVVGKSICNVFAPFEHRQNLVITHSKGTEIQIKLPRFHLTFFVNFVGGIRCNELSAQIDSSQDFGTLYGLESRLILRSGIQRIVLIPNGEVRISRAPFHVAAKIILKESDSLTFSQYHIDSRLGQLISPDLDSHLYKSYLHAITSFPEPDPLTGRSGTEECLFGLSETICRTSVPLSARSQSILNLISGLSPQRKFYPPHLKVMQSSTFDETLPVVSQRDVFFGTAHELVMHNIQTSPLFDANVIAPSYRGDFSLLNRAHRLNRHLYPSETGVSTRIVLEDEEYSSRDRCVSRRQKTSSSLAALIQAWPSQFDVRPDLKATIQDWKTIGGFDQHFSAPSFSSLLKGDLKDDFASLVTLCRSEPSKEQLVFILSLMAFGNPEIVPKLKILLAFAVSPRLQALSAPEHDSYDLRQGFNVRQKDVLTIISECEKEFAHDTDGNSDEEGSARQLYEHESKSQRQLILEAVHSSWPANAVKLPSKRKLTHYDVSRLKELLNGRFAAWYKNHVFLQQLQNFDDGLRDCFASSPELSPFDAVIEESRAVHTPSQNTHFTLRDLMNLVLVDDCDFSESLPTFLDHSLEKSISKAEPHKFLDANQVRHSLEELDEIVEELGQDHSIVVRNYGQFLGRSIEAMKLKTRQERAKMKVPDNAIMEREIKRVKDRISFIIVRVTDILRPRLAAERALIAARVWPQVSELTLLQLLSAAHRDKLPRCWRRVLIDFAKEITALQRLERIQKYINAKDSFALNNELANPAHDAWSQEEWPDWLLLEIQNNILIRPVQVRVARELIEAEDGVVLLGMGEGKTSVIVPLVVTALAKLHSTGESRGAQAVGSRNVAAPFKIAIGLGRTDCLLPALFEADTSDV